MRLYASQGIRGTLVDLETGLSVPKVIWYDTDKGELEAYKTDRAGGILQDINGDYLTYRARGSFKFLPFVKEVAKTRKVQLGASSCSVCSSQLTLPGSELCPRCNAVDKHYTNQFHIQSVDSQSLLSPDGCEHPGCNRVATWQVSDEVEVSPSKQGRLVYERGATVGRHGYCAAHWSPARLLDAKGEVIKEYHEAGGVRPT